MEQLTVWDSALYAENFSDLSKAEQIELWTTLGTTIQASRCVMQDISGSQRSEAAHQLVSALGCLGLTEASAFFRIVEHQSTEEFSAPVTLSALTCLARYVDDQLVRLDSK
jgi:hypothetical protein